MWQAAHDLERVRNDADGHELLAVVAAVHHQRVGEALNDGAVGLAEALGGIATGGVRDVDGGADLDVVAAKRWFVSYPPGQAGWVCSRGSMFGCRISNSGGRFGLLRQGDVADLDIIVAPAVCERVVSNQFPRVEPRFSERRERFDVLKSLVLPSSWMYSLGSTS